MAPPPSRRRPQIYPPPLLSLPAARIEVSIGPTALRRLNLLGTKSSGSRKINGKSEREKSSSNLVFNLVKMAERPRRFTEGGHAERMLMWRRRYCCVSSVYTPHVCVCVCVQQFLTLLSCFFLRFPDPISEFPHLNVKLRRRRRRCSRACYYCVITDRCRA